MKGPIRKATIKISTRPNFCGPTEGRRAESRHPIRAAKLAIEFLSNGGIISNLITAPTGSSKCPHTNVNIVAWLTGFVEYKTRASMGKVTRAIVENVFISGNRGTFSDL